jgi:hypothetical protein
VIWVLQNVLQILPYIAKGLGMRLIVGVYIDDLVITGTNSSSIKKFKEQMCGLLKMSDLGLLSYYLCIEVKQGSEGSHYLRELMLRKSLRRRPGRLQVMPSAYAA